MQHYGAPTRVLDWTESPFVALYFAVEKDFDAEGAVWIVNEPEVEKLLEAKYPEYKKTTALACRNPESPRSLRFLRISPHTDRMGQQQTMFSVSPAANADHGQIIADAISTEGDVKCFRKWLIPRELKVSFLRHLRAMNITGRSLFPGLDGLGRSISEIVRVGIGSAQ
jgi:hypothetical protein